jgi:hypothetical protein
MHTKNKDTAVIDKILSWLSLEGQFWVAVVGATIVKLLFSEKMTIGKACATGFSAVFFAWVFTRPTLAFFGLAPDDYMIPVAVLWGLMGENIMRQLIRRSGDKDFLASMISAWRGK